MNNSIKDILDNCPKNTTIINNMIKAYKIINDRKYHNILVSISGGADSDIMLDIVERVRNFEDTEDHRIMYAWFDTGLEYQATKDHLDYLEDKYNIKIERIKSWEQKGCKNIIMSCREHGEPFVNKFTSEMIQRLQSHNFEWEDDSFDNLYKKYPKCKAALMWWCNEHPEGSHFNISRIAWLKEFILINKPDFKVSNKCCLYAKKKVSHTFDKVYETDLKLIGVRKAEGGIRSLSYKNCYDSGDEYDNYRPLFWYTNQDKQDYEEHYGIVHSRCYTEYDLKRTGCTGCPYGRDLFNEIRILKQYEPKLYNAVTTVFMNSYSYAQDFENFKREMNNQYESYANYLREKE